MPVPEVDVAVVKFVPRDEPLIRAPFELVEKVCRHLFHYRRKYSFKAALTLYPDDVGEELAHEVGGRAIFCIKECNYWRMMGGALTAGIQCLHSIVYILLILWRYLEN